jgi:hypothetical protein
MDADVSDSIFGSVAAGLGLLKLRSKRPLVSTGGRPIPSKGVSEEEKFAVAQLVPEQQVLRELAPRFYALERTEPEPKVMPEVLRVWGL